jgi:hypothetical protein
MSSSDNNNNSSVSSNSNITSAPAPAPTSSSNNNNTSAPAPAPIPASVAVQINNNNNGSAVNNEWTKNQIRLLINQRKHRNIEYYRIIGRSRRDFWNSVARRINRSEGTNFSGKQCKRKFQNLVSTYYVSKLIQNSIYIKLYFVN